MTNTLHGPYVQGATTTTGPYGTGGGQVNTFTSGNGNNAETQSAIALASFGRDHVAFGFTLSGATCTGVGSNTLTIASGTAYIIVSDNSRARVDIGSTTQTTAALSSTYYLYLQPDGTWYWNTVNSPAAHSLAIAQVTTDGAGLIATITDTRSLSVPLFTAASGIQFPSISQVNGVNTQGALGVAGVVKEVQNVAGSGTSVNTILSYTTVQDGTYRVSCGFRTNATGNVTLKVQYTDRFANIARTNYPQCQADSTTSWVTLNATSTPNSAYVVQPIVISAKIGTTITVGWGNSAGGGSDAIDAVVELI